MGLQPIPTGELPKNLPAAIFCYRHLKYAFIWKLSS